MCQLLDLFYWINLEQTPKNCIPRNKKSTYFPAELIEHSGIELNRTPWIEFDLVRMRSIERQVDCGVRLTMTGHLHTWRRRITQGAFLIFCSKLFCSKCSIVWAMFFRGCRRLKIFWPWDLSKCFPSTRSRKAGFSFTIPSAWRTFSKSSEFASNVNKYFFK